MEGSGDLIRSRGGSICEKPLSFTELLPFHVGFYIQAEICQRACQFGTALYSQWLTCFDFFDDLLVNLARPDDKELSNIEISAPARKVKWEITCISSDWR